VLKPEKKEE